MIVAQKLKEAEITEHNSRLLLLTRNLLRMATHLNVRCVFPQKYFKEVPSLVMKIKKLMPIDAESRRLIDWLEKGVYDFLQIEEHAFSFSHSNSDSQEVAMNINRSGNKKGTTFMSYGATDVTASQMRNFFCEVFQILIQLIRTLDRMPVERTVVTKLQYYDDVTPIDYEPPFCRSCSEQEADNQWTKDPLKVDVGDVNSKHLILALKVNCGVEGDDLQWAVKVRGNSDGCPYCTTPYLKNDSWRSSEDLPSPKKCECSDEEKAKRAEEARRREELNEENRVKAIEKCWAEWKNKIKVQIFYVDTSFKSDTDTSYTFTVSRDGLKEFDDFSEFVKDAMNRSVLPPPFVKQSLRLSFKDAANQNFDLNRSSWSEFKRKGISAEAMLGVERDFRKPFLRGSKLAYHAMLLWGHANTESALITGSQQIESGLRYGTIKFLYLSYLCPIAEVSEMVRLARVANFLKVPFVFHMNVNMMESIYGVLGSSVTTGKLSAAVSAHKALRDLQGDIWGVYVPREVTVDAAGNADAVGTAEGNNGQATDDVDAASLADAGSFADAASSADAVSSADAASSADA